METKTAVEMSFADILKTTQEIEEKWRSDGSMAWYRGHADAKWELKSTLNREILDFVALMKNPPSAKDQVDLLRKTYKTQYRQFRAAAWMILGEDDKTGDWRLLFAMQHHGQVTRLLDWSESFASAVYFALERSCEKCHDESQNAAIWMLDPQALNNESQGIDGLIALDEDIDKADGTVFDARAWHPKYTVSDELSSIAVAPDFTNARITAQRGAFTMAGDSFLGLDAEFKGLAPDRLRKLVLTPAAKKDAATFLMSAGVDAYSVYPDLHGLAIRRKDHVRKRRELMKKVLGQALK